MANAAATNSNPETIFHDVCTSLGTRVPMAIAENTSEPTGGPSTAKSKAPLRISPRRCLSLVKDSKACIDSLRMPAEESGFHQWFASDLDASACGAIWMPYIGGFS